MSDIPRLRGRPRENRGGVPTTILLYPRDKQMIEELKEYFSSDSASDVVRTSIRTLYVNLLGKSNV